MHEPLVVRLSGVPVGKGRPRFVRRTGIAFTPQKTRSYEDALRYVAQVAMDGRVMFDGPLSVAVEAIFPVPGSWSARKQHEALHGVILPTVKPDLDNLLKCVDAFNQVVWADDKQIVEARIVKRYGSTPELKVTVEAYDGRGDTSRE